MRDTYIAVMGRLQQLCMFWSGVSIVAMTIMIFTGVVMRYGFSTGARFAEPMSIFFAVQLTMYGAAACYRANVHLRLTVFVNLLPKRGTAIVGKAVQLMLGIVAIAMIYFGWSLARTTWFQSYPEFEAIRVGVVYMAIPFSGVIFLLFIIEHLLFGQQGIDEEQEEILRAVEHAEQEARQQASR
jgi:TRAP-type C4-dicarboxylate transport system permease small subunit